MRSRDPIRIRRANNLIKRIKRIGFRNFENYRIRALLYAGKPNWRVLASIVVR
jgi:transposase